MLIAKQRILISLFAFLFSAFFRDSYANCTNELPLYKLKYGSHISYLVPTVHSIRRELLDCVSSPRLDNILPSIRTIVVERTGVGMAASLDEVRDTFAVMYPGLSVDTAAQVFRAKNMKQDWSAIERKAAIELFNRRGPLVSEPLRKKVLDWVDDILPNEGEEGRRSIGKLLLSYSPATMCYRIFLDFPSDPSIEKRYGPGHEYFLQEYARIRGLEFMALEQTADIYRRMAEEFPSENAMEQAVMLTLDATRNATKTGSMFDAEIEAAEKYQRGDSSELISIYDSAKETDFQRVVLQPVQRRRELQWVMKVKELISSDRCPCLFAVGASHVALPYFRAGLDKAGMQVVLVAD